MNTYIVSYVYACITQEKSAVCLINSLKDAANLITPDENGHGL